MTWPHIHKFGKWELIAEADHRKLPSETRTYTLLQKRTCLKCNYVQVQKIKEYTE